MNEYDKLLNQNIDKTSEYLSRLAGNRMQGETNDLIISNQRVIMRVLQRAMKLMDEDSLKIFKEKSKLLKENAELLKEIDGLSL